MGDEETAVDALAAAQEEIRPRATKLVQDAASILEEELSTGIGAARSLHERIFAEGGTGEDPSEVVQRLRRDAHDAVDVAADVLASVLTSLTTAAERAAQGGGAADAPAKPAKSKAKPKPKPRAQPKPAAARAKPAK